MTRLQAGLVIHEEQRPASLEFHQVGVIDGFNFRIRLPGPDGFQHGLVDQQAVISTELPFAHIQTTQLQGDFDTCADRLKLLAIGDQNTDSTAQFPGEFASIRRELQRHETHTRQLEPVQLQRERLTIEPGRSKLFKRGISSASDRQVGRFEQADAGVEQGLGEVTHIRRRVGPLQPGGIKIVRTPPAFERDDLQVQTKLQFGLEHPREFPGGHAVPYGKAMEAGKGLPAFVQQRAADRNTVDRVWPVEHNKANMVFSGSLHGLAHGRNISIKPCANILDVKDQCVYTGQHGSGGAAIAAIQTDDFYAGGGIRAVINERDIKLAHRTVLGAEQGNQIDLPGVMEKLDSAVSLTVNACLVGNQADIPAAELFESIPLQYVDSTQGRALLCTNKTRRQADGYCYYDQLEKSQHAFGFMTSLCGLHSDNFQFEPGNIHYTDKQHARPH